MAHSEVSEAISSCIGRIVPLSAMRMCFFFCFRSVYTTCLKLATRWHSSVAWFYNVLDTEMCASSCSQCAYGVVSSGWTASCSGLKSSISNLVVGVMQHTYFVVCCGVVVACCLR
uniref:(northern house mosquito) hypothetical protein n=1 Tax=Culex pipiens TaxID=7175 RepID=A0A8D8PI52_CULPI